MLSPIPNSVRWTRKGIASRSGARRSISLNPIAGYAQPTTQWESRRSEQRLLAGPILLPRTAITADSLPRYSSPGQCGLKWSLKRAEQRNCHRPTDRIGDLTGRVTEHSVMRLTHLRFVGVSATVLPLASRAPSCPAPSARCALSIMRGSSCRGQKGLSAQ
jgi:hypothetical protein